MPSNDQGMTKPQTPMTAGGRLAPSTLGFGHSLGFGIWSLVILLGSCPAVARSHPVPKSEYDRNVTVEWRADGVYLLYRLEIDEYTLLTTVGNPANGFPLDPKKPRVGRKDVADAYIARMREIIPDGVTGSVDGKPVTFACTDVRVDFLDSAQFRFKLKAAASLTPGRHTLEVEDLNFLDKKGKLALKFEPGPGLSAEKVTEPPEGAALDATEAERRTVAATVVVPGTPSAPALVTGPAPEPEAMTPAQPTEPAGVWELLRRVQEEENLAVLLDSKAGLWLVLLIAALHGVLHSVSPGHGKTMVAAYLIGEQGTPRHAIILGLIVTLTHTSAAFAVAL